MTDAVMQAAGGLAAALLAENDALRAMDVPRALTHVPQKAEWSRRLHLALSESDQAHPNFSAEQRAAATASVARLQALAVTNRLLLERAMFVQGRLIAILARAVPASRVGYGRAASRAGSVAPLALSARV